MGRYAIAAEATLTGSCNRGDRFRLHVDEPDGVIVAFGDVNVPLAVEAQLMRRVELRGCGRAAIAGIPLCSRTRKYRDFLASQVQPQQKMAAILDRKSTRLNSSHGYISYAVFCLKKKK